MCVFFLVRSSPWSELLSPPPPPAPPPPAVCFSLLPKHVAQCSLNLTARGTTVRYLDTVHHRASLEDLAPGTRYFYRCGNPPDADDDAGDAGASSSAAGS